MMDSYPPSSTPEAYSAPPPPPPPPPPAPMPAPPPPAREAQRGGWIAGLGRLGALFSLLLLIFLSGFYVAVFALNAGGGPVAQPYRSGSGKQRVAILPIRGFIGADSAEFVRVAVDRVADDETVRAVVLRVESGGGGVSASDQIFHELKRLRERRPGLKIVASYGSVAASGGYYVSCAADRIFVEPTSITGSIGVIGQVFTVENLLNDKLGVKAITITASGSPEKEVANNLFRDWNEQDIAAMRRIIDDMYERFVDVVAEGRAATLPDREAVRSVATGQVFTAREAMAAKLVDEIGYLNRAIDTAADLAGLDASKTPAIIYEPRAGLSSMFGLAQQSSRGMDFSAHAIRAWINDLATPRVMYLYQP